MDPNKVESLTVLVRCLSVGRRTYNCGRVITASDENFPRLCETGRVSEDPEDKSAHLFAKMKAAPAKPVAKKAPAKPAASKKAAKPKAKADEGSSN